MKNYADLEMPRKSASSDSSYYTKAECSDFFITHSKQLIIINFLTALPPRRLSLKHLPISRGGPPHMKGVGMLVGNFELNP